MFLNCAASKERHQARALTRTCCRKRGLYRAGVENDLAPDLHSVVPYSSDSPPCGAFFWRSWSIFHEA